MSAACRHFFICALFVFLAGLFVFVQAPARAQVVTVRVGGAGTVTIPDKNAADPRSRADRAVIDAFEREHPNIRLVNANGLQISGPASESNLLMSFAGGTAPDVVYVNFRSMENFIQQGFLSPLDPYLAKDPQPLTRVNPQIRKVITVNGHVYALPWAQFVQALYYRRDLFQEAGLDPDKPPTTWDQFYDDCKKITNPKTGVWGFEWPNDAGGQAYWWVNFLWQAGGEVTTQNAKGQWVAAFDSPQGVQALEFYKRLVADPYVSPVDGKTYHGVANTSSPQWNSTDRTTGKVAMWFAYQSSVVANLSDASSINPSLVGIAAMPAGPGGKTANEINASMWGMSSQIKDPKVREAAWEFMKFMGSDEADRIRTQAYVQAGLGNLINPVSLVKYGYADEITHMSQSWLAANKTLFAHGHPEPYGANMEQIYDLLGQPLQEIQLHPNANPQALLADAARQVNEKLIGYTTPAVMARRRAVAWSIFGVLAVGFLAWAMKQIVQILRPEQKERLAPAGSQADAEGSTILGREKRILIYAWLFMLPAIASVILWAYYPLLRGLVMAFEDYKIILGQQYIGLDNFIDAFTSQTFWIGLWTALEFTAYSLALGFLLPVFLAIMLNEVPVGTVFFRSVYYLPAVISSIVVSLLWKQFADPTSNGLMNQFIGLAHIPPQNWLGDPKWAMLYVVLPSIWAAAGPGTIIYLAAMKSVPDEMYEAADIDGAGIWTKIWKVTVPTLWPLMLINLVGATIGAFQANQNILVMTGGGPLYATHTIGLDIFYNAFMYLKFGYATAEAWVVGALLVGFTLFQLRAMRNMRFAAAR